MSRTILVAVCLLLVACGQPSPSTPTSSPAQSVEAGATVATSPSFEATGTPTSTPTPTPRFAFPVTCGPMDPVRCEEFVEQLVEGIAKSRPGKTIARIVIETEKGSYQMDFTDGTGVGADVD